MDSTPYYAHELATSSDQAPDASRFLPRPHERVLYWGSGSPAAWRAFLMLSEKKLEFRSVCITFQSGVLKSKEFLKMNPRGMVPIFVDINGVTMYESIAIMEYLERVYPTPALMPIDPMQLAVAETRVQEANNLSVVAGEVIYYLRRVPEEKRNPSFLLTKLEALQKELQLWEQYLSGRTFLAGDSLSLADISFFPNLAYNVRCGLRLRDAYPALESYYQMMVARPSVIATWPPHWKESTGLPLLSITVEELRASQGRREQEEL